MVERPAGSSAIAVSVAITVIVVVLPHDAYHRALYLTEMYFVEQASAFVEVSPTLVLLP